MAGLSEFEAEAKRDDSDAESLLFGEAACGEVAMGSLGIWTKPPLKKRRKKILIPTSKGSGRGLLLASLRERSEW